jgi:hypothetical protein
MGAIQNAVVALLRASVEPMHLQAIKAEVDEILRRDVSLDTINSYLSVAAKRRGSTIIRVAPGIYTASAAEC